MSSDDRPCISLCVVMVWTFTLLEDLFLNQYYSLTLYGARLTSISQLKHSRFAEKISFNYSSRGKKKKKRKKDTGVLSKTSGHLEVRPSWQGHDHWT